MSERTPPQIASRKVPKQARSADLVAAVLDAAVQVLAEGGAARFTTVRVAERAGVSVGSLYQYFPNKAAILFRLQSDEWRRTAALLGDILAASEVPPLKRLRRLVHAFVRSECEEAPLRQALGDAAPLYRDAPETREARQAGIRVAEEFMREVLPDRSAAERALGVDLVMTVLSKLGKHVSDTPRSPEERDAYAEQIADMLCAYVEGLRRRP